MSLPTWWKEEKRRISRLPPSQRAQAIRDAYKKVEVEFDSAGLCVRCGDTRSRGKFCLRHAAKHDFKNEERRAKLKEAGLCIACGNEHVALESNSRCRVCLDKEGESRKLAREEAVRVGLCDQCGQAEPMPGIKRCEPCRTAHVERSKALRDERRSSGLCIVCGGVRDGQFMQCARCIERRRPKGRRDVIEAMKVVLEYETEWFETGMIVKDEKYLVAKELVEKTAV